MRGASTPKVAGPKTPGVKSAAGGKGKKTGAGGSVAVGKKSKTGNAQCSEAMSAWVLGRHNPGSVAKSVYQTLAKCRKMVKGLNPQSKEAQGRKAVASISRSERLAQIAGRAQLAHERTNASGARKIARIDRAIKLKRAQHEQEKKEQRERVEKYLAHRRNEKERIEKLGGSKGEPIARASRKAHEARIHEAAKPSSIKTDAEKIAAARATAASHASNREEKKKRVEGYLANRPARIKAREERRRSEANVAAHLEREQARDATESRERALEKLQEQAVASALKHGLSKIVPVSRAIDNHASRHKQAVVEALQAIDSVHRANNLNRIPIFESSAALPHGPEGGARTGGTVGLVGGIYSGSREHKLGSKIVIAGDQPHPRVSTLHEIGHHVDIAGIPATGPHSKALAELHAAIADSPEIKGLAAAAERRGPHSPQIQEAYAKYLDGTEERFARAYAQHIASKSNHAEVKREFEDFRAKHSPETWSDQHFKPISEKFDALFKSLKWSKNHDQQTSRSSAGRKENRRTDARRSKRQAESGPSEATRLSTAESAAPKPGDIVKLVPQAIAVNPGRFQFKLAHGESGSVGSLAGVKKYDHELAGVIQVWHDPADKKTYVVNGHNRLDAAKKLGADHVVARYIEAKDATEARAKGAITNIAEGRGTATDAAKFFRDTGLRREDLAARGVPLHDKVAADGLALAELHPALFKRVVDGDLSVERGAIVGGAGLDHAAQASIMKIVDSKKGAATVSNKTLRELVADAKQSIGGKAKTANLFGDDPEDVSLALHRAKVTGDIKQRLGREKKLFGIVSKSRAAAELEKAGNSINREASSGVSKEAAQTLDVFDRLRGLHGPISRHLNEASLRIHNGENHEKVVDETYKKIVKSIPHVLNGTEELAD